VKVRVSTFSWEPVPDTLSFELEHVSAREWLVLRETLRRELGAERDRCNVPGIITPVAKALARDGDVGTALALARACLAACKPTDSWREDLVAWLAQHDPAAGGAALRVKEAPMVLAGWLELERERAGDAKLTEALARLCPFDVKRWSAAGLPSAPWFSHPRWPLARTEDERAGPWRTLHLYPSQLNVNLAASCSRELTGWEWPADWSDVRGESLNTGTEFSWDVFRMARYRDGAELPTVQVSLLGLRGNPFVEKLQWVWVPGQHTGDVLLIVERELPQPGAAPVRAIAFTAVGSSEFRAQADALVTRVSRLRWYDAPAAECLEPWQPPEQRRFLDADVRSAVRAALAAAVPEEELASVEPLLGCTCTGACEHQRQLMRVAGPGMFAQPPSVRARSTALMAAARVAGLAPDYEEVRRLLKLVELELVQAAEFL
jgi:hypothetical protein